MDKIKQSFKSSGLCHSDPINLNPFCQVIGPYLFGTSQVKEVLLFLVLIIVNPWWLRAEWQEWIEYRIAALRIQSLAMTSYKVDVWFDLSRPLSLHCSNKVNNIDQQIQLLKYTSVLDAYYYINIRCYITPL